MTMDIVADPARPGLICYFDCSHCGMRMGMYAHEKEDPRYCPWCGKK